MFESHNRIWHLNKRQHIWLMFYGFLSLTIALAFFVESLKTVAAFLLVVFMVIGIVYDLRRLFLLALVFFGSLFLMLYSLLSFGVIS